MSMCVTWNQKKMVICPSIFQENRACQIKNGKIRKSFLKSGQIRGSMAIFPAPAALVPNPGKHEQNHPH